MDLWIFLNAVFMVLCWNWASRDFENGHATLGWMNIFFSAWNGAAIAVKIF